MKAPIHIAVACIVSALHSGQAQAGACTVEVDNLTKTMSARDAGSGPTSGAPGQPAGSAQPSSGAAQHPPAEIMSREAQGRAASPEDVRRQTEGRPTASAEAKGTGPAGSANNAEATAALDRARGFDRAGNEAACMEAVQQAKRLSGG